MAKRGENIYLRKDGRWEGRYIKGRRPDGKSTFGYVYGKKYSDVKQVLCKLKANAQMKGGQSDGYDELTLGAWAKYWIDVVAKPNIKPTTYDTYRNQLFIHILPYFGEQLLRKIDCAAINQFISYLKKRLADSTVCTIYRLLKSILLNGVRKKILPAISFDEIKKPRKRMSPPRFLTRVEQKKLEKEIFAQGSDEYLLGLYAGLRLGEICALKWKDVDFVNNTLRITHSAKRIRLENPDGSAKTKVVVSETKSETSRREIPVPAFLMERLVRRYETGGGPDGFVFPGKNGRVFDPRTMQQRLERLARKAGIRGVHMHTLRHSFATRCLEQNIGVETLSDFLGHSSPEITWRYYAHCTWEHKAESIGRLRPMACNEPVSRHKAVARAKRTA